MKNENMTPETDSGAGMKETSPNIDTDPLWTVDDVALYLRLEPDTVRSMVREGKLPAMRVGRVYRFQRSMIQKWLNDRSVENSKE